jgi:ubiquinone/menaquinone biosynthesis C-methylase UbiE
MSGSSYEEAILEHYKQQANEYGLEPTSTMLDQTTRAMEVEAILSCIAYARRQVDRHMSLLEIGCGNGYLLESIRARFPDVLLTGVDYSPDMIALAAQRNIENCKVYRGDIGALDFEDASVDFVASERCIINLLEREVQYKALNELHRVLKPGGLMVLVESFADGLENLNRARNELGLPGNVVPHHNLWFDKTDFLTTIRKMFEVVSDEELIREGLATSNFLSSHYFMSRVVYPCVTRGEILYNSEFVKFFRFLPPMGNYSPIQLFVLRKSA